jgi:DNA modification methylase
MTVPMSYFRPNTIYCGDCKDVLSQFPNQSVDLIYADPFQTDGLKFSGMMDLSVELLRTGGKAE